MLYISSKLQMLPESVSVLQSCCCHHGAWDMQKVIRLLITSEHILHAFKSLPQASTSEEPPGRGKGCRGEICLLTTPPPLTH